MNKHPYELNGIVLSFPSLSPSGEMEVKHSYKVTKVLGGISWDRTHLPPEECTLYWEILQKCLTQCIPSLLGLWLREQADRDAPGGWANACTCTVGWMGLSTCDPLFPPSHSLPVHSTKLSSQSPIQAGDDEKNQRTITVNPAHMGKAFKVMNELRRYISYFACALLEATCLVSVIRFY